MTILSDHDIRQLAQQHRMLEPFSEAVQEGVVSYGLTHAGYDLRLGSRVLIFKNSYGRTISPKRMKDEQEYRRQCFDEFVAGDGQPVHVPGHGYVLGYSLEYIRMPRWLKGCCVGKSTLARCGILVNTTPLEPGWHGHLTIEIANVSPCPVELYPGEGVAQLEFHTLTAYPSADYGDKGGKYQGQGAEPVPARVKE